MLRCETYDLYIYDYHVQDKIYQKYESVMYIVNCIPAVASIS